jgi:hypothetical protein
MFSGMNDKDRPDEILIEPGQISGNLCRIPTLLKAVTNQCDPLRTNRIQITLFDQTSHGLMFFSPIVVP